MLISRIAASLKPIKLRRDRRGYTLTEAVLVLAISSMLIYGLGILVLSTREQMWISQQIRHADEWGLAYVNDWARVVKHAESVTIRRANAPSWMVVNYIEQDDPLNRVKEYSYQWYNRMSMPVLKINGRLNELELYPTSSDSRDSFRVERAPKRVPDVGRVLGFVVYECKRQAPPILWRKNYLTMEFSMIYERSIGNQRTRYKPFKKKLNYLASAYSVNTNWAIEDETGGFDDPEDG